MLHFASRATVLSALLLLGCAHDPASLPEPDAMPPPPEPDAMAPPPEPDAMPPPATRFELDAVLRNMPATGLTEGFSVVQNAYGVRYWATVDLDGDGALDIVHSGDTAIADHVWDAAGAPYWKVFRGGNWNGPPMSWAVPPSGQATGFFALDLANGVSQWRTLDLDGDRRLDLVQSTDPATGKVWDYTGTPYWKVYLGGESGFAGTATIWPVPTSGTTQGFHAPSSAVAMWRWRTFDLTGDGIADLVQTADPATDAVWDAGGAPHWKVFAGTGLGFTSSPIVWTVGTSGTVRGFHSTTSDVDGERWSTFDLDGDGRLDLVQTAHPVTFDVFGADSAPYWKMSRGQDGSFAAAQQWAVPTSGLSEGFYRASAELANHFWSLLDIDGDGDRDLVQTGDVAHASQVWDAAGTPYWKVFRNDGTRFVSDVVRWNVPKPGTSGGFYKAAAAQAPLGWFVDDVDADGYLDLVHTMDPSTSTVWDASGSPYWKVFRGRP